jgi:hypothetical protein
MRDAPRDESRTHPLPPLIAANRLYEQDNQNGDLKLCLVGKR